MCCWMAQRTEIGKGSLGERGNERDGVVNLASALLDTD